jgi:membrane peptidoglycan carboxypeptidase
LRQPGSSIKPIAYLTAMEEGFTPNTILWDVPTEFSPRCSAVVDFSNRSSLCYHPQNFDLTFRGPVTMQQALAQSINVPAVKTLYLAGLDNVIKMASRLGINTLNDPSRLGLSLVLGGGEVRLIDLAAAYAAIANDGVYREPTGVLRIEDSEGKTLEEYKDSSEQAVDPQYARIINDILSNVELRSGLFHASLGLTQVPGRQVALKTGTTNDYVDAWTFGYTPDLVAGVWVGNNDREPLTSHGSSILAAVPMWHDFFSKAVDKTPSSTFARPENTTSDVPALRGELSGDNLHNILYYLSRQSDPQFNNWEVGVQGWLQSHSVDLNRFKSADGAGDSGGGIKIAVSSPASGSFATDPLNLSFTVSSEKNIKGLEVYLNGRAIDSKEDLGKSFTYNKEVPADSLQLQNLITINVLDEGGSQAEERIIVFK